MVKKCMCFYLVLALFIIGIVPRADAAFTPSTALTPGDRASDIERIRPVLEHKLVAQRLLDLGFNADEITTRIAALNDQQLHSLAQQLDELRVGQMDAIWWAVVAAAIILVVFVFLPMVGVRIFG